MKTVLIVDDVPANVDVILGFLTDAGYRVWLLMEAIALWNSSDGHSPDIILLDRTMLLAGARLGDVIALRGALRKAIGREHSPTDFLPANLDPRGKVPDVGSRKDS